MLDVIEYKLYIKMINFDKEVNLSTECDEGLFQVIEQELNEIIEYQMIRKSVDFLSAYWNFPFRLSKYIGYLYLKFRIVLMLFSFLVIFISLYSLSKKSSDSIFWILLFSYGGIAIFTILVKDITRLKRLPKYRLQKWSSKKLAHKFLTKARDFLPYRAYYSFSEENLSYFRICSNEKTLVWSKKPEAFAIVHHHVVLFFKNSKSQIPKTIVMFRNQDELLQFLDKLAVEYVIYENTLLDDVLKTERTLYGFE